ncbi:LysR substrate-binding domain-containing protein [Variovorax terrae]|uniref:LysR substrate-binding domain-containing protein n=1 Tax=Variovorax terrae TaxID=2923278 RepID=A0A9X1VT04_9BURK|nr:LysR substrate-binding domain-containing protein [Variovorax terrae]MCJ0763286.1 LysR substrate-binding domain-containing protein [Variovorax terrae]
MKYHQLRCFLAIAQYSSIRAAARSLPLSQPAVTKSLRELEEDLGVPLVVRSVSGIRLTEFGEAFRLRASSLIEDGRRAREELQMIRDGSGTTVSIAVSSTVALTLLPKVLIAFRKAYPRAKLSLWEDVQPSTLNRLRDGTLDLVVSQGVNAPVEPDVSVNSLYTLPSIVGARADHPLARSRSLKNLIGADWLLPSSGHEAHGVGEQIFAANGLPIPMSITSCYSLSVALGIIKRMDYLSVFAEPLAKAEFRHHGLKALPLRESLPPSTVSVLRRRDSRLTMAAGAFLEILERLGRAES